MNIPNDIQFAAHSVIDLYCVTAEKFNQIECEHAKVRKLTIRGT